MRQLRGHECSPKIGAKVASRRVHTARLSAVIVKQYLDHCFPDGGSILLQLCHSGRIIEDTARYLAVHASLWCQQGRGEPGSSYTTTVRWVRRSEHAFTDSTTSREASEVAEHVVVWRRELKQQQQQ